MRKALIFSKHGRLVEQRTLEGAPHVHEIPLAPQRKLSVSATLPPTQMLRPETVVYQYVGDTPDGYSIYWERSAPPTARESAEVAHLRSEKAALEATLSRVRDALNAWLFDAQPAGSLAAEIRDILRP